MLAIGATEWGYVLALVALLPLLPGWRRSRSGRLGAALGLIAAVLAISPLLRAWMVARKLPAGLESAFGNVPARSGPDALPRPAPLVAMDLLRGISSPPVQPSSVVYLAREQQQLQLDLYQPREPRTASPGVVVIHGGSWQRGDSTQLAPLNGYLAARGYLVAAINYRLSPAHQFPAARDDVQAAIAYLKTNAAPLGLDAERLVLLGRSAGGQLALLVAYTARDPAIRGVISFYGWTDLRHNYAYPANPRVYDTRGIFEAHLGGSPDKVPALYDAASPINFVGPGLPPTLLIHGGRDELISLAQSEFLAARLAAVRQPHFLLSLPWATHGCDYNFSGPCGQLSTYAIERFLAAVTK
jgi:acetyl esterase/lipase